MHRVRYYSQLIPPDYFRGKGLRGWWIRVLNRFRLWVETKVAYHVMRILAREDNHESNIGAFIRSFKDDAREERELLLKPKPLVGTVTQDDASTLRVPRTVGSRRDTDAMIARMTAPPRQRRYTRGNSSFRADPEGDFESPDPVEDTNARAEDQEAPYPSLSGTP